MTLSSTLNHFHQHLYWNHMDCDCFQISRINLTSYLANNQKALNIRKYRYILVNIDDQIYIRTLSGFSMLCLHMLTCMFVYITIIISKEVMNLIRSTSDHRRSWGKRWRYRNFVNTALKYEIISPHVVMRRGGRLCSGRLVGLHPGWQAACHSGHLVSLCPK